MRARSKVGQKVGQYGRASRNIWKPPWGIPRCDTVRYIYIWYRSVLIKTVQVIQGEQTDGQTMANSIVPLPDFVRAGDKKWSRTILHKVVHKKFPQYLLNDLPYMCDENTRLERWYKFNTPVYNYAFYRDSFIIPSVISNWNNLPNDIRTNSNIKGFKFFNKKNYMPSANPLYHHGERLSQMSHSRIRLNFSNLNSHLYNHGLITSPNCDNCDVYETPFHFFMECTKYPINIRTELINKIKAILPNPNRTGRIPLKTLLHGKTESSVSWN